MADTPYNTDTESNKADNSTWRGQKVTNPGGNTAAREPEQVLLNPPPSQPNAIKSRQGNETVDFNDLDPGKYAVNAQGSAEEVLYNQHDDMLKQLGMLNPPAPTYDANREKRLETMAGASGVMQALSLLGDAFGVQQGATVRNNAVKQPGYIDQILRDRKEFQLRKDAADYRNYQDEIRKVIMGTQAKAADQRADIAMGRNEIAANKLAGEEAFREKTYADAQKQQKIDNALKAEELRIRKLYNDGTISAKEKGDMLDYLQQMGRNSNRTKKDEKGTGQFIYNSKGEPVVEVNDPRMMDALYSVIMDDPAMQKDMDIFKARRDGVKSTSARDQLIAKAWEKSPKAQEFLRTYRGEKPAKKKTINPWLPPDPNFRVYENTPEGEGTTAAPAKKVDYSKLNY